MSKASLIQAVANSRLKVPKTFAAEVVEVISEELTLELLKSGEASLPGIGKLKLVTRTARTARNPKTGESLKIKAGKRVKFVVSKALKEGVA
jgi:Bacterial nucleoid DNA-binding protein